MKRRRISTKTSIIDVVLALAVLAFTVLFAAIITK